MFLSKKNFYLVEVFQTNPMTITNDRTILSFMVRTEGWASSSNSRPTVFKNKNKKTKKQNFLKEVKYRVFKPCLFF